MDRTGDEVALAGDERVAAARGCCHAGLSSEDVALLVILTMQKGCGSSSVGGFIGAESRAVCSDAA